MSYFVTYYLGIEGPAFTEYDNIMEETHLAESNYCTWYNHEQDMLNISKQYPTSIFTLEVWGDEDDIHIKYFMNGEMQKTKAQLVFTPCKFRISKDENIF